MNEYGPDNYLVQTKRVEWAERTLRRYFPMFTDEELLDIQYHIGMSCLMYDNDLKLEFDGTDLQLVTLATALMCVGEIREAVEA